MNIVEHKEEYDFIPAAFLMTQNLTKESGIVNSMKISMWLERNWKDNLFLHQVYFDRMYVNMLKLIKKESTMYM